MRTFYKYLITGISAAATEYILFALLRGCVGLSAAHFLSYGTAFAISFLMTKYYVFASAEGNIMKQLSLYATLAFINSVIGFFILHYLVEQAHTDEYLAKAVSMIAVVIWNFFICQKMIFRK